MKRLEDFTREDLAKFRKDICLNSLFYSDYRNSFGIDDHSASLFFDSYLSFISELAEEDGFKWDYATPGSTYYQEATILGKSFFQSTTPWIIWRTGTAATKVLIGLSMKTNGFVLPKPSESLKTL